MTGPPTERPVARTIRGPLLWVAVVFVLVSGMGAAFIRLVENRRSDSRHEAASEAAVTQARRIEGRLHQALSPIPALAAALRASLRFEGFDALAAELLKDHESLQGFGLAPGGVVRHVYPPALYHSLLDCDLLHDPVLGPSSRAAADSRRLTLSGPYLLAQREVVLLGLLPVMLPDSADGERLWGFVFTAVPLRELLASADLYRLPDQSFEYQLEEAETRRGRPRVLARSTEKELERPVHVEIAVPNGQWSLSLATADSPSRLAGEMVLVLVLALAASFSVHRLLRQPEVLRGEVERRRKRLSRATQELKAEVVQRQVAEALQRKAEEEARRKQAFAASVSHEIRTPMNGILGITNLLLETDLTDEQHDYVTMLKGCGESLLHLINDILDFSKLEAGKMELEQIDYDLEGVLDCLVDQFAEPASRKGIEFTCVVSSDVPRRLKGDPGRLRQVLVNLVGNAIKFTDSGKVVVQVTRADSGNRAILRFAVTDTGVGIPEEAQAKIFEPFSQADRSTTRKYGGTGLGLSIVRQIADRMGGRIEVQSQPGRGSTFSLVAPVDLAEAQSVPPMEISGTRSLVVDAGEIHREITRTLVEELGCRTEVASSAEEALRLLREAARAKDPFRLVLMGAELPDMDGLEATRAIRGDASLASATVILVSGFGIRGDAARAREAGCSGYLTKPIKSSQLPQVIAAALSLGTTGVADQIVTQHTFRRPTTRSGRILVAEDDPVNQRVAEVLLRNRGHEVVIASTGRQALHALSSGSFDLVLMDVEMPEMDGLQATRVLRADARWRALPVIGLTAHALPGDRERFLRGGMSDHLTKPFRPADLDLVLQRVLGSFPPPEAAPSPGEDRPASPAAATAGVLDWEGALERHGRSEPLLLESFQLFCESAPDHVRRIEAALAAGDALALARYAHTLRGSASIVGADSLATVAQRIEELGRGGEMDRVGDSLALLRERSAEVYAVVESLTESHGRRP